jgi:hypothetical protein
VRFLDAMMQIEKRLERLAERSDVTLQPIELRKRILDDVEALVEAAGRGRRVLPFNWIGVRFAAADPRRQAAIEAVLDDAGGLQPAIEARLAEIGCPLPPAFAVEVSFVETVGDGAGGSRPYALTCERRVRAASTPASAGRDQRVSADTATPVEPDASRVARLVVVKGEAVESTVAFASDRLNIGRIEEVLDKDHRVVRRNHLVFSDVESPVNQTVSRAQAHVSLTAEGEYRLYDDHSTYGTRIFRSGRTLEIPSGSPRGVKLRAGDEIYFGQACARFEVVER